MRAAAGTAVFLLAIAGCKSAPSNPNADQAQAIFRAPSGALGSGIDPEARGPMPGTASEEKPVRTQPTTAGGMQIKEVAVDPKDVRTRLEFVRTLLGQGWILISQTPQSDGIVVYKFMRKDFPRGVEIDPFGVPEIPKKEPPK